MSMYMGKWDEYRAEHCEHQGLDEADKHFQKHHENAHSNAYDGH